MIKAIFSRKMLIQFFLGLASGLPLLLTGSTLQAWMRETNVDLSTIGIFAIVGLPYTLKFLWSPLMDRFALPFLDRRRGWMILCQGILAALFIILGTINPSTQIWFLGGLALLITFFSASQDIVVDAYRREILEEDELGLGSSLYVNGYRVALLLSGAFALFLASSMPWGRVYFCMGLMMAVSMLFTLFAPRIEKSVEIVPQSIKEAVIGPFKEYFTRNGAFIMLLFILLYKVGDSMGAHMSMPLYLDKGYEKLEIASVAKGVGMVCTIVGGLLGGILMLKLKMNKSLWIFGILQMISTAGFSWLSFSDKSIAVLAIVIGFENLTSGMGTTAFVAFMASLTDKKFTATQYALLTSLMGVPRAILSAPTGKMVEVMGYANFYLFCTLIAIPGLLLLMKFAPWSGQSQTHQHSN